MSLFIFKTQDKEIAGVDLGQVNYFDIRDEQESIYISFYGGGDAAVSIENEQDRQSEFLRFTTAMQTLADQGPAHFIMFDPDNTH